MPPTRQTRKRPNGEESEPPRKRVVTDTNTPTKTTTVSKSVLKSAPSASLSKSPAAVTSRKATLFDDLDDVVTSNGGTHVHELDDSDSDDGSSLTSMSDADFEDVPVPKSKGKGKGKAATDTKHQEFENGGEDENDDDDDEDIEFEDVQAPAPLPFLSMAMDDDPEPAGDLELTLHKDTRVSLTNPYGEKKGPSKMERLVRNATHCVHVQSLLWHNALRNAWLCDPEVQGILLSHLPSRVWEEVDRWRRASGLEKPPPVAESSKRDGKRRHDAAKGRKGKQQAVHHTSPAKRPSREWSKAATRLEEGVVDMSHGDPLFRLMRALSSWWRLRFRITAPGLRKRGYVSLERLDRMLKAAKESRGIGPDRFGEQIRDLAAFRVRAQELTGSRDVGAQLFTALLRALGMEARMVASLQPLGFGWTKMEDADPEEEMAEDGEKPPVVLQTPRKERQTERQKVSPASSRKPKAADDDLELAEINSDNDSVVFIPDEEETKPKTRGPAYDKDLQFPHYWTEVLSPVTHKYLPVDAIVKAISGTNRELIESFEPRGGKADKARQVMAYVVGYSQDGTAKDVTVRYLKRQVLPGRTKGVRYPIVKVPIYNRHGKVKRYDQMDWFKMAMQGYIRGQSRGHPITEVDEAEDATDLRPARPEKRQVKEGEETLQYYKQSKEFVLERHLKREEALVEGAVPVKKFRNSKGKKTTAAGRASGEDAPAAENVFLRKDVVNVKSAETWHKQGRAPVAGQLPLKMVPYRAATINRKREIAEAEAASGEKVLQGLYSFEQTDWIIPPPIRNGIIPKNEYGNIDLFAEHMCPEGAVHVPFRGAMRICKKLQIDFAEAVIDFEFGHRMAVPVIQGVVIAEEHHDHVMEELAKFEAEKARKEDEKRRAAALSLWRKMLMGLRIVERIRQDYGEVREDERVFGSGRDIVDLETTARHPEPERPANYEDPDLAGGFLPEGYEYEEEDAPQQGGTSSFFPINDDDEDGGGFINDEADPGDLVVS